MRRISAISNSQRSRLKREAAAYFSPLFVRVWRGKSGRSFSHTVYRLTGCPAVASASYILVRREAGGAPHVLAIERTGSPTPSLNLARIRQLGATLGANEVHLIELDGDDAARAAIERDIAGGIGGAVIPAEAVTANAG